MRDQQIPCANASLPEVRAGRHLHMNDNPDRLCDRCLIAATPTAAVSDRVTATRSAGEVDRLLKGLLPTSPASSLPDGYAAGPSTPVAPLRQSQVER